MVECINLSVRAGLANCISLGHFQQSYTDDASSSTMDLRDFFINNYSSYILKYSRTKINATVQHKELA